jgi:hypothetical protein
VQTGQLKIASMDSDQIVAIKKIVLPALQSLVITIKHKGHVDKNSICIASITAPRMPCQETAAIVSSIINNNCKIIINNCAPYDVMIDRKNLIGIMDIESETLIPKTQRYHQFYLTKNTLPKVSKKKSTKDKIAQKVHLNIPTEKKNL